jgi:hypothetical protein
MVEKLPSSLIPITEFLLKSNRIPFVLAPITSKGFSFISLVSNNSNLFAELAAPPTVEDPA